MRIIDWVRQTLFLRKIVNSFLRKRARFYITKIIRVLDIEDLILDFGAGSCAISEILNENGYKVVPIDIVDKSFADKVKLKLYNGQKLPFNQDKFDVTLVIKVLHHTCDPEKMLKEVSRVSKKMIIYEEIYDSKLGKYLTFLWDDITNLEFFSNPHSNKTDLEWQSIFKNFKLNLISADYRTDYGFLKGVTYVLEK